MTEEIRNKEDARKKLEELLTCGNERVELAAAKELISIWGKEEEQKSDDKDIGLEVTIKIVSD